MTITDLHINFRVVFNKLNTNKNKAFLPEEIDVILSSSLQGQVTAIMNALSNQRGLGYEDNQYRLDMIQDAILEASTDSMENALSITTFNRGYKVNMPSDYHSLLGSTSSSTDTCFTYSYKPNRLYKSGRDVEQALSDYYSRTSPESPISELRGKVLYIYVDNFNVTSVSIKYLPTLPVLDYTNIVVLPYSNEFWNLVIYNAVTKAKASSISDYSILNNESNKNE